MNAEQKKELIRSTWQTLLVKGDVEGALRNLADDVEWESWADNSAVKAGVPWMVPRHGKAEAVHFFEAAGQMEILDLHVLAMMEGGNQVAVEFVLEANLPAWGGGHYRDEEMHLWIGSLRW